MLVISGRGARGAGPELISLLDRLGAVYLDTGESRGLVPDSHPSVVGAMRGAVMSDADVVLTVGRRLDFQLAYGSPAVFGAARFVRIGDCAAEMRDNRRGAVEILASPAETLRAMVAQPAIASRRSTGNGPQSCAPATRSAPRNCSRRWRARRTVRDGKLHPNKVLAALQTGDRQRLRSSSPMAATSSLSPASA